MADHGHRENLFDTIRDLEAKRGSRIYSMIHCGLHHICGPVISSLLRDRDKLNGINTLEILIHSPGGHPLIAYQAMKIFRRKCKRINALVPLRAKSAATLMCFGADAIYMGEFSELGPLDVQINDPVERGAEPFSPLDEFKSMEFLREYAVELMDYFTLVLARRSGMALKDAIRESIPIVSGMMRPLYEKIDPLEVGGHRRALAIGEEYARRLLKMVRNPYCEQIVEKMVWKYPSHDFVVDIDEAIELNLPVIALPIDQDKALVDAIIGLEENDDHFHGFVPLAARPSARVGAAPKKARLPTKRLRANGSAALQ